MPETGAREELREEIKEFTNSWNVWSCNTRRSGGLHSA